MANIPHTPENSEKIKAVAERLQGTCTCLDDVLEEHFGEGVSVTDFDIVLLGELDDLVMECQGCNWWCETHELDDDQVCGDCRPDEDEEG